MARCPMCGTEGCYNSVFLCLPCKSQERCWRPAFHVLLQRVYRIGCGRLALWEPRSWT